VGTERAPSYFNVDASIGKKFQVYELHYLDFRIGGPPNCCRVIPKAAQNWRMSTIDSPQAALGFATGCRSHFVDETLSFP
jgi:hypothetical protein